MTALFTLYLLVTLGAIWYGWLEASLLSDLYSGYRVSDEHAYRAETGLAVAGYAQAALRLALIALFCVWIHRAACNVLAIGGRRLRFTPGWCVGWFFVPFMNLFRPVQVVNDLWQASDGAGTKRSVGPSGTVATWWFLWIISLLLAGGAYFQASGAESVTDHLNASFLALATNATNVVLTVLAIMVVRGVHTRHEQAQMLPLSQHGLASSWGRPEPVPAAPSS